MAEFEGPTCPGCVAKEKVIRGLLDLLQMESQHTREMWTDLFGGLQTEQEHKSEAA